MTEASRHAVAPPDEADCVPHDRAVWRTYHDREGSGRPAAGTFRQRVSLDYGSGPIVCCQSGDTDWKNVQQWRFGWPPRDQR